MKNRDTGKVNASLVISMIALFIAISGATTMAKNNNGPNTKQIPKNSIGTEQLKPGAVQKSDLGKKSVVSSKLAPNSVTTTALAPESVKSSDLGRGSISPIALGPESVTSAALAIGAVDSSKIKDDAVGSAQLRPGSVTGPKLGPGSVGSEVIQDGAVETSKLGVGAVTNQKLSDDSVDKDKIKEGAVDSAQLKEGAVLAAKLGQRAVTPAKVDSPPGAQVSATNVGLQFMNFACSGKIPEFTTVSRNIDGAFSAEHPSRITAPIAGVYRLASSINWPVSSLGTRAMWVRRYSADGTLISTQSGTASPSAELGTDQAISADFVMDAGDYVELLAFTCGGGPGTASQASMSLTWAGPAS